MEDNEQLRTLYVGNIDNNATEDVLYELFMQAGPIEYARIPKGKNYAFVCFQHQCSVPYAVNLLDGTTLYGKKVRVQCKSRSQEISHTPAENTGIHSLDPNFNSSNNNGLLGNPPLMSGNYVPTSSPYPLISPYNPYHNRPGYLLSASPILGSPMLYPVQMSPVNQNQGTSFRNRNSHSFNTPPSIDTHTMNTLRSNYDQVALCDRFNESKDNHSSMNIHGSDHHQAPNIETKRFHFNKGDNVIFRKEHQSNYKSDSTHGRNSSPYEHNSRHSYGEREGYDRYKPRNNRDRNHSHESMDYQHGNRSRSDYNNYSHRDRNAGSSYSNHREKSDQNSPGYYRSNTSNNRGNSDRYRDRY